MSLEKILNFTPEATRKLSKNKIIRLVFIIIRTLVGEIEEQKKKIDELLEKNNRLQKELDQDRKQKINREVNQPSSKKPEWDKDGNPKPPTKSKNRKKKKDKKKEGSGNKSKNNLVPESVNYNRLDNCPECGMDLSQEEAIIEKDKEGNKKENSRVVEDIVEPSEKTIITKEVQERKRCPKCKKLVTARTERALLGSDIGINTIVLSVYSWVICCISFPKLQAYLNSFMKLTISTAGLSKLIIRVAKISTPIYDEILEDVRNKPTVWADETGWRIKGKLWWLWIFANKHSAYYWPDESRGSPVVERILGSVFLGVLISDAWGAYNTIVCAKQTCMVHISRKIRKFIEAYPQYKSIMTFYVKLRRIIKDGEKLQKIRQEIGEDAFCRRLKQLKKRLNQLLKWKNPNQVLKEVIKKVYRQKKHILTFVEYKDVPSHNNYGEYIIRKGVLKRKISGGSMSVEGARAYACLQSIAQTCHLRGIPFLVFLRKSLVHYILTGKPLLLSEYEKNKVELIELKEAA